MIFMTLKVGITGGIGSGKSLVCSVFETFGIPVYNADLNAKRLMTADPELKGSIVKEFGEGCYQDDGSLDREYLASIVFHDNEKLKILNSLVHPAVQKDVQQWFTMQDTPYAIEEAALIFESGAYKLLDRVITVTAPKKLRLKRVHNRDNVPYKEITRRMDNQWPEREKSRLSDFVIRNNGKISLISQIWNIHQELIRLNK